MSVEAAAIKRKRTMNIAASPVGLAGVLVLAVLALLVAQPRPQSQTELPLVVEYTRGDADGVQREGQTFSAEDGTLKDQFDTSGELSAAQREQVADASVANWIAKGEFYAALAEE